MAEQSNKKELPKVISDVSDMMKQLEQELTDIKNGDLPESTGRLVLGYRKEQIKVQALNLQYRRIVRAGGDKQMRFIEPKPNIPESTEDKKGDEQ